jgi:pyridoxamine 5'-phosphate oxidase
MDWLPEFRAVLQRQPAGPMVMTLATAAQSVARARSVICRRVGDDGRLWFTTDLRSSKMRELHNTPMAECVYWAAATRDQFRFYGMAGFWLDEAEPIRRELWNGMTDGSRAMFFWPAPGEPRETDVGKFPQTVAADTPPPAEFVALAILPFEVDHLSLAPHPHRRRRWTAQDGWKVTELNP